MEKSEWHQVKAVLDRGGFSCQMCGSAPGEIDELTGHRTRLLLGPIRVESLGGIEGLPMSQALCSTCYQGAKKMAAEKPTTTWLLSQIRRAGQDEQRAVFSWLTKKFGKDS
jgi:hypothetical protein